MTRQDGKSAVHKLVDDFEKNERQYMSKNFQETETRDRFIDPFFTALGWDFFQTNIAKQFWDVHREFSQRVNSTTKKPDYAFRVKEGSKHREKFFVEAKAPWVDLTGNDPVFQAKRYAFSSHGKTPIVILTDFQTFRVYNGLEKPVYENPHQGLIKGFDLDYHIYLDKWDTIWDVFSKEAVIEGSIAQLIGKVSRNTKSLDDEFLADISLWRETLARNVALRNKDLSVEQINEAVQRILDRLIFIRNLEDREIESENTLLSILRTKENIYLHLIPLFRNLDNEYNGLLFKEHFSEVINIDDKTIRDIIKGLCYPLSPYQFDIIEPEILGRIYERFLGSKIRLTENHQAKVEEKPEVRHAGGVYYTPQYIVDYIVENTVGIKVQNKSPDEIQSIKICDPACGSGSFLLGAFHYLIEYHREWYAKASPAIQKKYRDDFYTNADNEIQLTLKKKTEILKNNIFGVDIDREATEVAIMSLYLKILDEGYDKGQAELFLRGHILPDMTGNIKCGNSLIDRKQLFDFDMFGNELINPFDWDNPGVFNNNTKEYVGRGFPDIMAKGGFDCIISNPPYIKTQEMQKYQPYVIDIYKKSYLSACKGNFDIYIIFIEKALSLLNGNGLMGYICPHKFFNSGYGSNIRKIIAEKAGINKILHFGVNQIFDNATTYTALLFLQGKQEDVFRYFEYKNETDNIEEQISGNLIPYFDVSSDQISGDNWVFTDAKRRDYLEQFKKDKPTLEEITTNIFQGPKAGADPVFILPFLSTKNETITLYSRSLNQEVEIEKTLVKPYVKGKLIHRNNIMDSDEYIIFPYNGDGKLLSLDDIKKNYPKAYTYLNTKQNRDILLSREDGRFKNVWWSYSRPQNMQILFEKKILTPFNAFSASFSLDTICNFVFSAGVSGAYGILLKDEAGISYEYLLGLLNSKPIDNFIKSISTALRGGFYSYENKYIKQIPIYVPNPKKKDEFVICMEIEKYQKQILNLNKEKMADIKFLENKISELVERLYE
jgi:type I restriction-modification system DNA methylase subunit